MQKRNVIAGSTMLAATVVLAMGCSVKAVENDVGLTCDEFANGQVDTRVDANVRVFMEATTQFKDVSAKVKVDVRDTCAKIARDLDGDDTWSQFGDDDRALSNDQGTGACDVASARMQAIMEAHADANFSLVVHRGACHRDFAAQAACEQQCKSEPVCDPGTCETRCEPAALSVKCQGQCRTSAHCEGTLDIAANCQGQCDAVCQGACSGTCTWPDGHTTDNDPNCQGRCSASCNGKCTGNCTIEAQGGISCGADVYCTGGCEGSYTEPKCEKTFGPAVCHVNQTCLDSCEAKAEANLVCDPTTVELYANVNVHADVKKLVDTCNANLGKLFAEVDVQGKVFVDACDHLSADGDVVVKGNGTLNAKTVSCATTAAKQATATATSLKASAKAAKRVTDTCSSHSH